MRARRALAWVAFAAIVAACRPAEEGTLRAHWTSLDTALGSGNLEVPLRGTWCLMRGRLTLLGWSGDTGVGILVRTVKLAPGLFPVSDSAAARSTGATIAFRLATRSSLIALSSDSGAVALTSTRNGELAGRFVGWLSRAGSGPVLLTGRFDGLTAAPDTVRCDYDTPPQPPPPASPAGPDSSVS